MNFENFKAAMFDFDGTITEKGQYYPSQEMADKLVLLAQKMPIAICTGRQLESFEQHGLDYLLSEIRPHHLERFLENLYLVAENGCIGYDFNTELDKFEEFYRASWPSSFIDRLELMDQLEKDPLIAGIGNVHRDKHRILIVIGVKGGQDLDIETIYTSTDKIFESVENILSSHSPTFINSLHIGNAGIGVAICPSNSDKDRGIREFAQYLSLSRGYEFEADFRDIMVVGDSPQKGGNDFYFLRGEIGTPFTVGHLNNNSPSPKPVLDGFGNRLLHSEGTKFLINMILEKLK